jgi:hypothetical protein
MPSRSPRAILDGEVANQRPPAERLADALCLQDQLAGGLAGGDREFHRAGAPPLVAPLLAHILQGAHPPLVALAARRHSVADPIEFGEDLAIQFVAVPFFLLQHLVAPRFKIAEAPLQPPDLPTIEPERGARKILQEAAVVAHQHEGRAHARQLRFQPFDRRQIEVVGGLVEDQHIRVGSQRTRQPRPPRLAAGKVPGVFRAAQAQGFQQVLGAIRVVTGRQPGFA